MQSFPACEIFLSVDPNNLSPLNPEAAEKWDNQDEFRKALSLYQKECKNL